MLASMSLRAMSRHGGAASDDTAEAFLAMTSGREPGWVASHHALKSTKDKKAAEKR